MKLYFTHIRRGCHRPLPCLRRASSVAEPGLFTNAVSAIVPSTRPYRRYTACPSAKEASSSDLEPAETYDDTFGETPTPASLDDPELQLFESYGLRVGTLFHEKEPTEEEDDDWGSGLYGEGHGGGDAQGDGSMSLTEEQQEIVDEIEFHFQARRRFEKEQVLDKAFELHHSQNERSVNPFATTLFFAKILEDIRKVDAVTASTSAIPAWARAMFVLEGTFEEWNESVRSQLHANSVFASSDPKETRLMRLREYEESVAELEGDFDFNRLNSMNATTAVVDEEEDISGVGDSLAGLLDVLPGLDSTPSNADAYAKELIPSTGGFEEELELEFNDDWKEHANEIDF